MRVSSSLVHAVTVAPFACGSCRAPQGYHFGAALLKLPARDLARFGYLYLNGGQWDGRQLIPAGYVRASIQPYGDVPGADGSYDYQWWETNEDGHDSFVAAGAGGQVMRGLKTGPRLVGSVVIPTIAD
jgi:CubicO group peptidase (beta-lactamase class C family)